MEMNSLGGSGLEMRRIMTGAPPGHAWNCIQSLMCSLERCEVRSALEELGERDKAHKAFCRSRDWTPTNYTPNTPLLIPWGHSPHMRLTLTISLCANPGDCDW
ncbi:hypothetical protein GDO81_002966 [Engystomops pustulosus]|uniref:Uncharacterized protein n=1 Tax=Engystomops pustulosus TaxID=76066 RepID=A0AAV7DRY5_ENGPU|nr:hypothetical protein GDO81_002966 [Engystomops pustulosus]